MNNETSTIKDIGGFAMRMKIIVLTLTLATGNFLLGEEGLTKKLLPVQEGFVVLENEKIPIYGKITEVTQMQYSPNRAPNDYFEVIYTMPDKAGKIPAKAAAFYNGKEIFGIKAKSFNISSNPKAGLFGATFQSCEAKNLFISITTYNGICTIVIRNSCDMAAIEP